MADPDVGAFPFILVDKILGSAPGERAIALRNVTANDPLLASGGARPDPAAASPPLSMRRGLLIEAFSQVASYALAGEGEVPRPVEIARIDSMRFLRSPVPGDQLVLTVEISKAGDAIRAACKAEAGGELVAEGTLELEPLPAGAGPSE